MPPTNTTTPITGTAADSVKATRTDIEMACQTLVAGLLANYQPGDVFKLKAGSFTRDQIVAAVVGFINDCEDTKAKKQAWRAAVQTERTTLAQVRPIRTGLHTFFQTLFGKDGAELRTYGFEPQKPRATSVKAKATGQQKAAETRVARGTKGKKQRQEIKAQPAPAATTPAAPKS
jgi:hypothetical protein